MLFKSGRGRNVKVVASTFALFFVFFFCFQTAVFCFALKPLETLCGLSTKELEQFQFTTAFCLTVTITTTEQSPFHSCASLTMPDSQLAASKSPKTFHIPSYFLLFGTNS